MTEYIEREALMRRIKEIHCAECDSYHGVRCRACWVDDTLDYIDSEPAAERRMIMSIEYPCVYWSDGMCKKFSDDKVTSFCVEGPCGDQMPSNADKIRAMSDEELVKFIKNIKVRAAFCKAVKNNDAFEELCSAEWLQQPAEEGE